MVPPRQAAAPRPHRSPRTPRPPSSDGASTAPPRALLDGDGALAFDPAAALDQRSTAEMVLMFRLGRPDVLPVDDYGVRKGFAVAFRKRELPAARELEQRGMRWRPYRTIASWYLWRAAERARL